MLLRDYRTHFIDTLIPLYDDMEAESLFNIVLGELNGWRRVDMALNPQKEIDADERRKWDNVLEQLTTHKPVQYIFGKGHFYGMMLLVNEHTLIPRVETEELVDWMLAEHKGFKGSILDIGTGSGCIAISLARSLKESVVSAMDISSGALALAWTNADRQEVKVKFIHQDVLELDKLPEKYDIIVSNPPYVMHREKNDMRANVMEYEPHSALFVEDDNPLLFYRKIALLAQEGLNPGGWLYFEINENLGNEMLSMMQNLGFTDVELRQDMFGKDRMMRGRKN